MIGGAAGGAARSWLGEPEKVERMREAPPWTGRLDVGGQFERRRDRIEGPLDREAPDLRALVALFPE